VGGELFYVEGDKLVAIDVTTSPELRIGPPQRLFSDPSLVRPTWEYDVSADGRFVMIEDVEDESGEQRKPAIHVTENWYEEFRERK